MVRLLRTMNPTPPSNLPLIFLSSHSAMFSDIREECEKMTHEVQANAGIAPGQCGTANL